MILIFYGSICGDQHKIWDFCGDASGISITITMFSLLERGQNGTVSSTIDWLWSQCVENYCLNDGVRTRDTEDLGAHRWGKSKWRYPRCIPVFGRVPKWSDWIAIRDGWVVLYGLRLVLFDGSSVLSEGLTCESLLDNSDVHDRIPTTRRITQSR